MSRKAIFPGTFDPPTIGHIHLIRQVLSLFDEIIVLIGCNAEKKSWFTQEERLILLQTCFADISCISVKQYSGLTTDFCKENDIHYIVRGLRNTIDFEYEKSMAQINADLDKEIETVFIIPKENFQNCSSTVVRELLKCGADIRKYLPDEIKEHPIIKNKQ